MSSRTVVPALRAVLLIVSTSAPMLSETLLAEVPSAPPPPAEATEQTEAPASSFFAVTTVTATGSERDAFDLATPVTVISAERIERLAVDNAAELLREQPGVDVNGVGPNQARPVIRGQRGLRVLFLEDGLRLNNARRQTDFGEISGLVDLGGIAAVEVVRGSASVLYGSDAIGGVLNLVPKRVGSGSGAGLSGFAEGRYSESDAGTATSAGLAGRTGRFDAQAGGSWRESDSYDAPAGRFGAIRLADQTTVLDSGVEDQSFWGSLGLQLAESHGLRLRAQSYRAEDAGFGYVPGAEYGVEEEAVIRILYPDQKFDRVTLAYEGSALGLAVADSIDAKLYRQENRRRLVNDIDIDIGPLGPGFPSSAVQADTANYTELETWGTRLEAIRALGDDHLLTWGVEAYRDDSFNTDFSVTTTILRFPFPPFERRIVSSDGVANAPNATNQSVGLFVQDEVALGERLRLSGGLRWQQVETRAEATPDWDTTGLDFDDRKLVGALTATWQISDALNALASVGTAFRAPSIVERLFNGITPEGAGFQVLNAGLESESSESLDLGLKYRQRDGFFEVVAFRTEIEDGIVQYFLSPAEIAQLPAEVRSEIAAAQVDFVVQQRNAERLRYQGIELAFGYRTRFGLAIGGNASLLDGERIDSANPPTGDTYGEKYVGWARWEPASGRIWAEYRVRHNASTDVHLSANEPAPPVGRELPSFTVHTLALGASLFERAGIRHELKLSVENLTDELYAEFSNATFFRPEPGRDLRVSYRMRFR